MSAASSARATSTGTATATGTASPARRYRSQHASSVRAMPGAIRRIGYLQMDPIASVATPQQLVLWSRLGVYDVAELDRLLWDERKLVEVAAFIWPIEMLPLLRARMRSYVRTHPRAREWLEPRK